MGHTELVQLFAYSIALCFACKARVREQLVWVLTTCFMGMGRNPCTGMFEVAMSDAADGG